MYYMVDSTSCRPMSPWSLVCFTLPVPTIFCHTGPGTSVKVLCIIFWVPLFSSFPLMVLTLFSESRLGLPQCLLHHHIPYLNRALTWPCSSQHSFLSLINSQVSYLRHPECPEKFFFQIPIPGSTKICDLKGAGKP